MTVTRIVRLVPDSLDEHRALSSLAGACRYVWNRFLGLSRDRQEYHRLSGVVGDGSVQPPDVSREALEQEFRAMWDRGDLDGIRQHNETVLLYQLELLADDWKRKRAKGQYPSPRGKKTQPVFTLTDDFELWGDTLVIPGIGAVRMADSIEGQPIRVTVRRGKHQQWTAEIVMLDERLVTNAWPEASVNPLPLCQTAPAL